MRLSASIAAGALSMGVSAQNYLGFNSGATLDDMSAKFYKDYMQEFTTAQNLNGAPGKFNSVRLYTNIQAYSEEEPIEAFDAAVETKTNILLGVWASGTTSIDKEIRALNKAIEKHGDDLLDLIIGVSIGSEDLYRISATGVKNKSGVGNGPKELAGFISDWRDAYKGTPMGNVPVGHVDTWDVWPNVTNKAVIDAVDWIGVDEYPYYENGKGNSIDNAANLFDKAYDATVAAAAGKPVWVTETGWPATGPDWDEAEASVKNAKQYWDEVGCEKLFGKTPTFWYTLRDSNPDNTMKFAITNKLSTEPLFDLSCPKKSTKPETTSSASASASATKSASPKPTESDSEEIESAIESVTRSASESATTESVSSVVDSVTSASESSFSGPQTSVVVDGSSTFTTTTTPSNTPAPVEDGPSESGSDSAPTPGSEEGAATGTAPATPTDSAVPAAAGLSLKGLSFTTYGALALVGGVMALF